MAFSKKIPLGELLVQQDLITRDQLQTALAEQSKLGRKLGSTLVELGMIDQKTRLEQLANQLNIPCLDINNHNYSNAVAKKLPESVARRYRALVVEDLSLIHISEPTRPVGISRMPSSA